MIKISRPTPKDVFLRQNLFERLDSLRRFPVIWISAPAGSGKTTLVSSYAWHRNIPCLWYQLDRRDADPATFFYYMREAAQRALPRKRFQLPLFTPEYHQGIETFVLRYFEHLYGRPKTNFLIVFDNFQEAPDEAPFQEVMKIALSLVPEGLNVIVISRNDIPPFLSRLRADRSVGFVGWEEIRLTEAEALGIIGRGPGEPPLDKTVHSLYELSDGWAAGLILLHEACRRDKLPPDLAGKKIFEDVFEYFAAEIFQQVNPEYREFFLKTAFLPKMTVPMAEQLTGNKAAGRILRAMNRNNFFIMRHAGAETVYDYHPLFREFLMSTAQKALSPDTLTAVRRSAAAVLEKAGMTEDAVALLKGIADWGAMVDIIVSHAPEMLKQGRHGPLQTWLKSLPEAVLESNPWLLYWKGMSHFLPFSSARAAPAFESAFSLFQAGGDTVGAMLAASGVINSMADQQNFTPLDHWYEVLNDLALRAGDFPNAEIEATVLAGLVSAAVIREKSAGEFEMWKQRLLNIPDTPFTISAKAWAMLSIFHQRLMRRGCQDALPPLHELQRLSRLPEAPPLVTVIALGSTAMYNGYRGSHNDGREAIRKVLEISRETGIRIFDMFTYVAMAQGCIEHMDLKSAEAWLDRIPPATELTNSVRGLYHVGLMRIAVIRKEYSRALQEIEKVLPILERGGKWAEAGVLLQKAQVYQMMGERRKASMLLEQIRSDVQARNSDLDMEMLLRIEAQFAFDAGDDARGVESLGRSLALGRKIGGVFPCLGHPAKAVGLYERALEAEIEVEYVQEIIRRLEYIPEKPPFHIENWPWPLKVYTLGRFTIVKDGETIRFSGKAQRMPLRLLKVLISLGGREISEGSISEQLWPDADGDMAHHSIENNLLRLRKLLGHAEALRFRDGKLTLDGRYCWVDIWAFERLLGWADEQEVQGDTGRAQELAEKALALYRQDFMAGDSDEVWVISPSERLKAKYFNRLMQLGRVLETAGHIERAVNLYERGLGIDDCMEEIYQRLMICHRHLGQRVKALAAYERCKKALDATLCIEPSDETEAIHSEILSHRRRLRLIRTNDRHRA